MEKGKKNIRRGFYKEVVRLADGKHAQTAGEQAGQMWRRILRSFASHPDGGELADGFVAVIRYFSGIGYWNGYKRAKRHYANMNSVRRTPNGREEVHRAIEELLNKDINIPVEKICEQLDEMKLSTSFDLRIKGKQKTVHVGPMQHKTFRAGPKPPLLRWASVRREGSVKNMISRLRDRVRDERNAKAWMTLSDRASHKAG